MAEDPKRSHTLADHLLGQDVAHAHDGEADHDHDHFEVDPDERLEENPIWIQDHVTLLTVGIDIGSAGTQVIFSRINLRRYGEDLTSRYYVVSRETLFQSPVALTPYSSDERIDDAALGAIIDDAYKTAGVQAQDIDTGVVILTGEALRRENAEAIAALLAEHIRDRFHVEAAVLGNQVRIEREGGHRFVPDVVEAFPGEIQAISVSKPALEDVFIHRTGHKFWSEEREINHAEKNKKKRR